jgi:hypothetical protein
MIQQYHTARKRVDSLVGGSSRAGLVVNTGIYVSNIPGLNVTRITIQDSYAVSFSSLVSCTPYNPLLINCIVWMLLDLTLARHHVVFE